MIRIPNKILIYLFFILFISACHTLEHRDFVLKPVSNSIINNKIDDNFIDNYKSYALPKKENVSDKKRKKTQKIIKKTSVQSIINKSKITEIEKFNPKSILKLSEKQLFEKMGKSDFVKQEGKLKNHQYYFSNCFVDIFLIKKEDNYLVDFFQRRPINLNGFLNENNCLEDISKKIKGLKK